MADLKIVVNRTYTFAEAPEEIIKGIEDFSSGDPDRMQSEEAGLIRIIVRLLITLKVVAVVLSIVVPAFVLHSMFGVPVLPVILLNVFVKAVTFLADKTLSKKPKAVWGYSITK